MYVCVPFQPGLGRMAPTKKSNEKKQDHSAIEKVVNREHTTSIYKCIHGVGFIRREMTSRVGDWAIHLNEQNWIVYKSRPFIQILHAIVEQLYGALLFSWLFLLSMRKTETDTSSLWQSRIQTQRGLKLTHTPSQAVWWPSALPLTWLSKSQGEKATELRVLVRVHNQLPAAALHPNKATSSFSPQSSTARTSWTLP